MVDFVIPSVYSRKTTNELFIVEEKKTLFQAAVKENFAVAHRKIISPHNFTVSMNDSVKCGSPQCINIHSTCTPHRDLCGLSI